MQRIPSREKSSVTGVARRKIKDSKQWAKASIPVAAVTFCGRLLVSSGSTIATSGIRVELTKDFFTFSFLSINKALDVASAPVPAVVGIMIIGSPGMGIFSIPM